jgi:hypothetical protein
MAGAGTMLLVLTRQNATMTGLLVTVLLHVTPGKNQLT